MRLTSRLPSGDYAPLPGRDNAQILDALGRYEDLYDALAAERDRTVRRMDELRAQGRTNTATYRQLIANKLTVLQLISRFDIYRMSK